jgi:RNA polymerase sigma-70 factor (ECF subfamily)
MTVQEYNKCADLYADNLYRFILKSIQNKDNSKDLVQDAYEILWLNIKSVEFDKAKSYLFTVAYRKMIDFIRKNKRISAFETAPEMGYSHSEQYNDLKEILNDAVSKLPEDQRTVVLLRDYEGYSYDEISEITDLSESQVKVYIFRARVFLKNYIKNPALVI